MLQTLKKLAIGAVILASFVGLKAHGAEITFYQTDGTSTSPGGGPGNTGVLTLVSNGASGTTFTVPNDICVDQAAFPFVRSTNGLGDGWFGNITIRNITGNVDVVTSSPTFGNAWNNPTPPFSQFETATFASTRLSNTKTYSLTVKRTGDGGMTGDGGIDSSSAGGVWIQLRSSGCAESDTFQVINPAGRSVLISSGTLGISSLSPTSDGQVLTASSGAILGFSWETPATGVTTLNGLSGAITANIFNTTTTINGLSGAITANIFNTTTSINGLTGAITANIFNTTTTLTGGTGIAVTNGGIGATTLSLIMGSNYVSSTACGGGLTCSGSTGAITIQSNGYMVSSTLAGNGINLSSSTGQVTINWGTGYNASSVSAGAGILVSTTTGAITVTWNASVSTATITTATTTDLSVGSLTGFLRGSGGHVGTVGSTEYVSSTACASGIFCSASTGAITLTSIGGMNVSSTAAGSGILVSTTTGAVTITWSASVSTGTITAFNFTEASGTRLSIDNLFANTAGQALNLQTSTTVKIGHLLFQQPTAPAISSCGAGSAIVASSTDQTGYVNTSSTPCVINFSTAGGLWGAPPYCDAGNQTSSTQALYVTSTASQMTIGMTTPGKTIVASSKVGWACFGYK